MSGFQEHANLFLQIASLLRERGGLAHCVPLKLESNP